MNRRRILTTILMITLVATLLLCGTVLAYMFKQTGYKENQFTPAVVTCEVVETFDGTNKTSIQVKNTGNIDAYLRVRLVSYWVDSAGKIVAKASVMPGFTCGTGWVEGKNDTYYYQSPIKPEESTPDLLSSPMVLGIDTENSYYQVVEVFAEAIQSEPSKAVTSSWGVSVNTLGFITAVP